MMKHLGMYAKAYAAFLTSLGTWGYTATEADNSITIGEWFGLCGVVAGFLLVFAVPNSIEVVKERTIRTKGEAGQVRTDFIWTIVGVLLALVLLVLLIRMLGD